MYTASTPLPGFPSICLGFLANMTYQFIHILRVLVRFPRMFFQVSEPISALRRSGLALLFPTLCHIWGSDGVVPPLKQVPGDGPGYEQLGVR